MYEYERHERRAPRKVREALGASTAGGIGNGEEQESIEFVAAKKFLANGLGRCFSG